MTGRLHGNNSKWVYIKQSPAGQQMISLLTMIIDNKNNSHSKPLIQNTQNTNKAHLQCWKLKFDSSRHLGKLLSELHQKEIQEFSHEKDLTLTCVSGQKPIRILYDQQNRKAVQYSDRSVDFVFFYLSLLSIMQRPLT